MRRSWRVAHPLNRAGAVVLRSGGRGGPAPAPGPQTGQPPRVPGGTQITNPLDQLGQALSGGIQQATGRLVGGGEVALGLVLVVVGLLLATGLAARGARAGVRVATRGVIR